MYECELCPLNSLQFTIQFRQVENGDKFIVQRELPIDIADPKLHH